jgi:molybdopterin-binding protein
MNIIKGKLIETKSKDDLNLLIFECYDDIVKVVTLEINFKIDEAELFFKPTMVSISKEKCNSSIENSLKAKIKEIEKGEIFSNICCEYNKEKIEVIVLNESVENLDLKVEDEVYLMIKASDIGVDIV